MKPLVFGGLTASKDVDSRKKEACKQGERRELTGSLVGCYYFLAAAKKSLAGR